MMTSCLPWVHRKSVLGRHKAYDKSSRVQEGGAEGSQSISPTITLSFGRVMYPNDRMDDIHTA